MRGRCSDIIITIINRNWSLEGDLCVKDIFCILKSRFACAPITLKEMSEIFENVHKFLVPNYMIINFNSLLWFIAQCVLSQSCAQAVLKLPDLDIMKK